MGLLTRQALHAKTLGFIHPVSGKTMRFDTDLPEDMKNVIDYLRKSRT
jgi:23S rRNA pseudouridine1911/1915/1917 synthase